MFAALKRHPMPIEAFFRYSLVLTYAYPEDLLRPLLPPGLTLDTYQGLGFLAIALVQANHLRPMGLPRFLGLDFFLSGYRIFSRFQTMDGRTLRGLRILRSDADSRFMVAAGNLLTHYRYRKCEVETKRTKSELEIKVQTTQGEADLSLRVNLEANPTTPPEGSPFPDLLTARRFAGPLPFTFDFEPESGSMVLIQGVRQNWRPIPVQVEVNLCQFLESPPFNQSAPRLANAFWVENIPYHWARGVLSPIPESRL